MDENFIRKSCPGVSFEGIAKLEGYRLTFNSRGKATVVESLGDIIWGVVWCMSSRDILKLDHKETLDLGKFKKLNRTVTFSDNRQIEAFIYIGEDQGQPIHNDELLKQIITIAKYWALPADYIEQLHSMHTD
jgi:hypothetical protein